MKLRSYLSSDLEALKALFSETILKVNFGDYSKEQVEKWASRGKLFTDERFSRNHTIVVLSETGEIAGFGMMDETAYFDLLYVSKDFQGQGVATAIAEDFLEYAKSLNAEKISTHASITARPFFEKMGYRVVSPNEVFIDGVKFLNYLMEKEI